jgi:preprotein translocase subunit SecF
MNIRQAVAAFRGHREPHFRIIEHRRWWLVLSGTVIVLSIVGLAVRHLNLSIDFEGGSQLSYGNNSGVSAEGVQTLLGQAPWSLTGSEVQIVGGNQLSVRTTSLTELSDVERTNLIDALAKQAGVSPSDISRTDVGPTWGAEISRKALEGLIVVLVAISIYIALRFEWKMAVGAQVAMVHDVLITGGVYALTGREVTPATVIAILTILGYSLYDTVVIYDKVKENTESTALLGKDTYEGVANYSMNQVLMRSVNTSLVVILPILSLLLFGGDTLKDFAFAMLVGIVIGAYSSIFVATPILVVLKEREPKYQQLRARLESRQGDRRLRAVPAPVQETAEEEPEAAPAAVAAAGGSQRTGQGGQTSSRPRPKSKRRPPAKRRRR